MHESLISVIIPVFNCEKYISAALESVFRQGYPHIEVIVIDDGSTDSTYSVLSRFGDKIRVIREENKGQSAARNVGIKNARGTIIGFLDADDIWPDDHISLMLPYLGDDAYDFVRGITRHLMDPGSYVFEKTEDMFYEALIGACLYKASLFRSVGLFDESMRQGEDCDWNIRLVESGAREKRIENITLLYRRHENNLTNAKNVIVKGHIDAIRLKLARNKRTS